MGKFLTKLVYGPERCEECPHKWDGRQHILYKDLVYRTDDDIEYIVPTGFCTDGASIPRFFWRILRPFDIYVEAAVLHDYFYSKPKEYKVSRKKADLLFREAMRSCGTSKWKRGLMWFAVRMFGNLSFDGRGKKQLEKLREKLRK